eukprot:Opistho-2@12986
MASLSNRIRSGLMGYLGSGTTPAASPTNENVARTHAPLGASSPPTTPRQRGSAQSAQSPSQLQAMSAATPSHEGVGGTPRFAAQGLVTGGRSFMQLLRGSSDSSPASGGNSTPPLSRGNSRAGLAEISREGRGAKLDLACASIFHALQQAHPPAITQHVQAIAAMLCDEDSDKAASQPCFRAFLHKGVLERLCSNKVLDAVPHLHYDLLHLFGVLLKRVRHHPILAHPQFRNALNWTLHSCNNVAPSTDIDDALVLLLHTICDCITRDNSLLVLFFDRHIGGASTKDGGQFVVFSLLTRYIHMDHMSLTDRAYDGIRLVLHLAVTNESLAEYIAIYSNFCDILALGLGGLYSTLPMTMLQSDDALTAREGRLLLRSLNLCCDAVRVGPANVASKLLGLFRSGFLQSVLVPSLLQPSDDAAAAATVHLTAMLRSIVDARVMRVVLDCLFAEAADNAVPSDVFCKRISEGGDVLCCSTLRLFHVLLELNCEDVVFELALRHLLEGRHVPVGMPCCTHDGESLVESARRFLSLAPVTPHSPDKSNFADYLAAAGVGVRHCAWACRDWSLPYSRCAGSASTGATAEDAQRTPFDGGPFIHALFVRLRRMLKQPVRTNLLLTAVISRLAMYPQPLLRSFLLDCRLVLAPGVVSLHDVLRKIVADVSELARTTHGFAASLLSARASLAHGVHIGRRASTSDLGGGRAREGADALMAVVCYEEFVKELAAIAQEHVTVSWGDAAFAIGDESVGAVTPAAISAVSAHT